MENLEKHREHVNDQLFEFFYVLKKKKKKFVLDWLSHNKDCLNKSTSTGVQKYGGYTPLHFAVMFNDSSAVNRLLEMGASHTIKNKNGQTPLHLGMTILILKSCSNRKRWDAWINNMKLILLDIFYYYVKQNEYTDASDNMGLSHFHIACYIGNSNLVQGFLKHCKNLAMNDKFIKFNSPCWPGFTAIHVAFKFKRENIIRLLVQFGADITASKDAFGLYPVHYAIQNCDTNIINVLYSLCKKNFVNSLEKIGMLPVHVYCMDNTNVFNVKLQKDLHFQENINIAVSLESPLWAGYTPLHIAIHNKCYMLMNTLITYGANINATDADGITSLQLAIQKKLIDCEVFSKILEKYNAKILQSIKHEKLYELICSCVTRSSRFEDVLLENKSIMNQVVPLEYPLDLPGYSLLHFGVEAASTKYVKMLLRIGADPCIQDANRMSPLHLAVLRGNMCMAKLILSSYGNVTKNPVNSSGISHMHIACMCDNTKLIKQFLDYGVSVNLSTKDGQRPLHFAVKHGSEASVKLLLQHKADFTAQDINGLTPLHLAIAVKNKNIADMILSLHNERIVNAVSSTGLSHFHIACMKNKTTLVETFLKHGQANQDPVKFNSDFFTGFTPLHFAIKYRCVNTVKLLLLYQSTSIVAEDATRKSPLHYIFNQQQQECKLILKLLWESIKLSGIKFIGTTGLSFLHIACIINDKLAIKQILKQDLDFINNCTSSNCPRWPGYSPMHFSAKYGDGESINILLNHRRNLVCSTDIYGFTPLHIACSNSKLENAQVLLTGGSDPLKTAFNNLTPLHLGASNPRIVKSILSLDIIKKCLEAGLDVNKQICQIKKNSRFSSWTLLLIALRYQDFQLAELLISYGAKVSQEVLELAIQSENTKLLQLLLSHTNDPTPALHYVIKKRKNSKCLKLLLDTRVNANDNHLHQCVLASVQAGGNKEYWQRTILCLLDHGFDLDHLNESGKSLLHLAYYPQNLLFLQLLLRCGADVNTEDRSGRTVVSYYLEIRTSRMNLQELRKIVVEHLAVRRSVPGFELSRTNEELYRTILEEDEEDPPRDSSVNTTAELEAMRRMKFGRYDSLYQMFRRPETLMAWYLDNPDLRDFLGTSRLDEDFPLCGCLIRMQYGKAVKRKRLLQPAASALDRLMFSELNESRGGETGIRIVVGYLENEDLRSLIAVFDD